MLNSRRIEIFLRVVMRVLPAFYFSTIRNFVHGNRNRKIMKLDAIIEDMQGCIFSLQQRVEELKTMDDKSAETILMTRQEAADMIGKSLRQLDRDCRRYGIRKVHANGGIRIPKIDLLVHMGLVARPAEPRRSELQRVLGRFGRQ